MTRTALVRNSTTRNLKIFRLNEYRTHIIAEWIPHMKAYRLYNPKHPQQTIAYEDDEDTARRHAMENGYEVTFECQ